MDPCLRRDDAGCDHARGTAHSRQAPDRDRPRGNRSATARAFRRVGARLVLQLPARQFGRGRPRYHRANAGLRCAWHCRCQHHGGRGAPSYRGEDAQAAPGDRLPDRDGRGPRLPRLPEKPCGLRAAVPPHQQRADANPHGRMAGQGRVRDRPRHACGPCGGCAADPAPARRSRCAVHDQGREQRHPPSSSRSPIRDPACCGGAKEKRDPGSSPG